MILFLDDNPYRTKKFLQCWPSAHTAETAAQMIELLQNTRQEPADFVFLDHDLGGEEGCDSNDVNTGMEVVRFVEDNKPLVRKFIVHTLNHPAGVRMREKLLDAGYEVVYIPFTVLAASGFVV